MRKECFPETVFTHVTAKILSQALMLAKDPGSRWGRAPVTMSGIQLETAGFSLQTLIAKRRQWLAQWTNSTTGTYSSWVPELQLSIHSTEIHSHTWQLSQCHPLPVRPQSSVEWRKSSLVTLLCKNLKENFIYYFFIAFSFPAVSSALLGCEQLMCFTSVSFISCPISWLWIVLLVCGTLVAPCYRWISSSLAPGISGRIPLF